MTEHSSHSLYKIKVRLLTDDAGIPDVREFETYLNMYAGERGVSWQPTQSELVVDLCENNGISAFFIEIQASQVALNILKWQDVATNHLRVLCEMPLEE